MAVFRAVDLAIPGGGFFRHERVYANVGNNLSYNNNWEQSGVHWWVSEVPIGTWIDADTFQVAFNSNEAWWLQRVGTSSVFLPLYGFLKISGVEDTVAGTWTFTKTTQGGMEITVFDISGTDPQFTSHTDANGVQTVATVSGNHVTSLDRTFTSGGSTLTDSLQFTYTDPGVYGKIATVTYVGSAGADVKRVSYFYAGGSLGSPQYLRTVTQELPDGSGGWNAVGVTIYRYVSGFSGLINMVFGPEACRQAFNDGINLLTASDSTVLPYADNYFEYDLTTYKVSKEIAAVCESCVGGGTSEDLLSYSFNPRSPANGYGVWQTKTVQTLPDSSQVVVYANYAGITVLKVTIDSTGSNMWGTFYRYTSDGLLMWEAHPSAVALPASLSTIEAYDDLLNYNTGTTKYQYLHDHDGLIEVTEYYSSTNLPLGEVEGYISANKIRQGQSGSDVLLSTRKYTSNTDSAGFTIYPVATSVAYPDDSNPSITITTSYAYTFHSGTNQIQQKTTTLPVVNSGQNGSGTADTIVEEFDAYGNLTQRTDERGIVNSYSYDVVFAVPTEQVLNVQSGVTAPGVNVTTDFTYDDQGRLAQSMGPSHTVVLSGTATSVRGTTWNVYIDSVMPTSGTWDPDQTWIGKGYATGTGPSYTYTLINPVSITTQAKGGNKPIDQITSVRTIGSGALSPTDTFDQSDWQSWSSTQYDLQHRTISQRVYHLIPSSGTGSVGTNYGETDYGYDILERRNRVVAPGGTITRTVWSAPQRVSSVWIGTDDTGATDSNPAGSGSPNNMVIVTANVYDGGNAGGDGNLTQQTQYASASDTRVTSYDYDFRDRRISMTGEVDIYHAYTYDNLNRLTQTDQYDTNSSGNLIGRTQTNYDDRNRTYQQLIYAVDPSTGPVGNVLTANTWYDPSSNVIQQIQQGAGQTFTKSTYNGVGWVTAIHQGYNTSGTSYSQAGTVTNDIIVEQTESTYDEVGNLISQASYQRLNDAPSSGSGSTGALSYGTNPKARVSYTASWFDGIDRQMAAANYGAISSFSRPGTPPSSSSTVLVNSTAYDSAGRVYQSTDPKGIITQFGYDAAGRKTQSIEDDGGFDRTTNFTYTLDNLIATITAVNSATGDQTTTYIYGTTLSDSDVARNDLLHSTIYPDSTGTGWSNLTVDDWADLTVDEWAELPVDPIDDVTTVTYNRLGQQTTFTDQRGTVHTYFYDKLGRKTDDCITTVGSDTDNAVLRISTTYEVRGMTQTITSYDNATPGSGTILNQVGMAYNDFSQLIEEQQDHEGAVSGSSPSVQYGYDSGASSSNEIRQSTLTYPNGRIITYDYGSSGGMDDYLNRISEIQDTTSGTTSLAGYIYLGAGTVIRITYPQPGIWLDCWGGTSGTFNGLDLFNRIIDQRWQNSITTTPTDIDRYEYGYDQDSNRLWKANVVGTPVVPGGLDEFYTYDNLNRLTEMQRGTLNSGKTGITGTPTREMDYTLDPTGNWSAYLTKTSGTTDLNQGRSANQANEITNITESGGTPLWVSPAYDPAGNMTAMPQVTDPTQSFTAVYDAWNRVVRVNSSGTPVGEYQYDGRNFRIVKVVSGGITHLYYTSEWQQIEERVDASTSMNRQCVWGIRYIDELVCRDDATPLRLYAMQDGNFNLTAVSDAGGNVQERYLFDPYGMRTVRNGAWTVLSSSAFDWVVGHQGLVYDEEIGAEFARHRHLQPLLGRWFQRDPVAYHVNDLLPTSLRFDVAIRAIEFMLWDNGGTRFNIMTMVTKDSLGGSDASRALLDQRLEDVEAGLSEDVALVYPVRFITDIGAAIEFSTHVQASFNLGGRLDLPLLPQLLQSEYQYEGSNPVTRIDPSGFCFCCHCPLIGGLQFNACPLAFLRWVCNRSSCGRAVFQPGRGLGKWSWIGTSAGCTWK